MTSKTTPASGYHDDMTVRDMLRVGAWELDIGTLPDGRWAIDFHNNGTHPAITNRRTRHYHDTEEAARDEFNTWRR